MSDREFIEQIRVVCEAFGIREFALYGRFAHTVSPTGLLLPPERLIHCDSEMLLAEEAAYYLDRRAQGLPY